MSRYTFLLNILDAIRSEATAHKHAGQYSGAASQDALNQARSRAFIHLYLKVSFGLLEFAEREHLVTDGSYDAGIDGYYLGQETKTVYFIQSKFRTSESNFESKEITIDEILRMDIDRVSKGEPTDGAGRSYNGKILQLEREISQIADIGRWKYRVVILANLTGYSEDQLLRLTENTPVEVFGAEDCYSKLVFPVISGTYYNSSELRIHLDLSTKYAGTKISYNVSTTNTDCEISVVFVPISEIAQVLHRYKNSILRYNPRSYLELDGKKVNQAIRQTVLDTDTNEFALFNNGITMVSDETGINERIGQRNKAQLTLTNPQIINGGQTAYTLSRLYEELAEDERKERFANKEVLLKVITLIEDDERRPTPRQKAELIDRISAATNQQTPVINADKFSNDQEYLGVQQVVFRRYGLLFERKRGEFADGLHKQYASVEQIIERNLFFKLFLAVRGDITAAVQKKLFMRFDAPERTTSNLDVLDKVAFAFSLYKRLTHPSGRPGGPRDQDRETYGSIYVLANRDLPHTTAEYEHAAATAVPKFRKEWKAFMAHAASTRKDFWRNAIDAKTGKTNTVFSAGRWMTSTAFTADINKWFNLIPYPLEKVPFLDLKPYERIVKKEDLDARELRRAKKQKWMVIDNVTQSGSINNVGVEDEYPIAKIASIVTPSDIETNATLQLLATRMQLGGEGEIADKDQAPKEPATELRERDGLEAD